jgi:histidine triad (HIT) family protein
MMDCLFCKMVKGEIKPDVVYEDETVLAFRDINPKAPVHVLVIPKQHITNVNDIQVGDRLLVGDMYLAARKVAQQTGVAESGYRLVVNCNSDAGESVHHLHLHIMGGRVLAWPPG